MVLLLVLLPVAAGAADGKLLQPLVPGWERFFRVDVQLGERGGKPVLRGYLENTSGHIMGRIRLLVEALDGTGGVVAQKIEYAPREMGPFSRQYVEVSAPAPAPAYRVQVFEFDYIDAPRRFP